MAEPARRVGAVIDPDALDRELAARGLEARDLSRLSGVSEDTLTKARSGGRVSRDTLVRIVAGLSKVRVNPLLAALVALPVADSPGKKNAAAVQAAAKEVARTSGPSGRS